MTTPTSTTDLATSTTDPVTSTTDLATSTKDLAAIAERFGTPAYVYDLDAIDARVATLRAALPPRVDVAYAVKANPALAIVARLGRLGLGADVASAGELATVARADIDPGRVVMTGPGKREEELRAAVAMGIRAITVESPGELERLERIAAEAERRAAVLLRAATSDAAAATDEPVRMIGDAGAGKFGMDRADLRLAARRANRSPHLELLGIHAFGASNVRDAEALVEHARATTALADELAGDVDSVIALIDVGGGLGIPYADDEAPLGLEALGRGLADVIEGTAAWPRLRGCRWLIEPGRYLVGPAGTYLTRVVDTKRVDGRPVVVVDGGIHHLVRPALVGQGHRIRRVAAAPALAAEPDVEPVEAVSIVGPLCSGLDVLGRDVPMPLPAVGDVLAIADVGAYGFTESMPWFLSHATAVEVVARGDRAELIRPREDPTSWLDRQLVPELAVGEADETLTLG